MKLVPRALLGMLALLLGNAYIVGINQIYDVDIDKASTGCRERVLGTPARTPGSIVMLSMCFTRATLRHASP